MTDPIRLADPSAVQLVRLPDEISPSAPRAEGVFGAVFQEAVDRVNAYQHAAGQGVERFLAGQDEELHSVAIAAQRADLAFDLFLQVKNKVVQAYQEVMRMQM